MHLKLIPSVKWSEPNGDIWHTWPFCFLVSDQYQCHIHAVIGWCCRCWSVDRSQLLFGKLINCLECCLVYCHYTASGGFHAIFLASYVCSCDGHFHRVDWPLQSHPGYLQPRFVKVKLPLLYIGFECRHADGQSCGNFIIGPDSLGIFNVCHSQCFDFSMLEWKTINEV